jgi:hypothetical protein
MGHYPPTPQHWALIRGVEYVRHGPSLMGLARSGLVSASPSLAVMLERLSAINPMRERSNHACSHLHRCSQDARAIVEDPAFGRSVDDVLLIMSTYETALIAGADGVPFCVDAARLGCFRELGQVSAIAWRQGDAIRAWWRSYAAAIEALFGGPGS